MYFASAREIRQALGDRPFAALKYLYISVPSARTMLGPSRLSATAIVRYLGHSPLQTLIIRGFEESFAPAWLPTSLWSSLRCLCLDAGSRSGNFAQLFYEFKSHHANSQLEHIRLETRCSTDEDFENIIEALRGYDRLRSFGFMKLSSIPPRIIRLVGDALPKLSALYLLQDDEEDWDADAEEYKAAFGLFEQLKVFGSDWPADVMVKRFGEQGIVIDKEGATIYWSSQTGQTFFPRPHWAVDMPRKSTLA